MTNSVNTNETATRVEVIDIAQQLEAKTSSATTLTGAFRNVFHYAAFCEHNFKRNVANNGTELQDTTFTSDLSIAEFCEQIHIDHHTTTEAVEDSIQRAVSEWAHDEQYIIALLFAVNMKSWEHHAMASDKYADMRAFTKEIHEQYAKYYSDRYYTLLDYVMEVVYKDDEETRMKIYQALD